MTEVSYKVRQVLQSVKKVYYKVCQVLQSMTDCYYNVHQVLQSVTDCYYKTRQVLQSATAITKWDVTPVIHLKTCIKGTVMQIEKAMINDRLRVLKVSWKFRIPHGYNFAVMYPWNLLFS